MVVTDMRAIMFTLKCWSGKIRSIVKVKNGLHVGYCTAELSSGGRTVCPSKVLRESPS